MNTRGILVIATALFLLSFNAHAHSPFEGAGAFYSGFLHPFWVPAHLLLLCALGLHIGQSGIQTNQWAVLSFVIATTVGLVAAGLSALPEIEFMVLVAATILGLTVASKLAIGQTLSAVAAAAAGFIVALDSSQESLVSTDKIVMMIGTGLGAFIAFCIAALVADYLSVKPWQTIAVRIMGSWIAAISLLVLALTFKQSG
ncbi:HupE/UreJ family protein [Paraferrimonas sedimenticola]|uniref:HupE / UreJ protein n=1 Tax=Paraferrimonas sedimenticola TaxID=375674 RepID=A0AA37VWT4_9GAMM|nr:HupE/UreJ family protein [Paraferrimonas sedimenticola]GLP96399.1 hypothetical protein GCM10007895_17050 [Paraferrimonas sedimenticola]